MKMRESFQGEVKICNQFILNAASTAAYHYFVQVTRTIIWCKTVWHWCGYVGNWLYTG